jgi:prepilin-type N-terminal cleavage/methylation domain-containing protein
MTQARKRADRRRPGFTLIEMLVVVAIISVLVSLTAVAVFRLIGTQQTANTNSELSKLQDELNQRFRAFEDKVSKEAIPSGGVYYSVVYNPQTGAGMAGGDANAAQRAQVIWRKLRLKQVFPQTFNEALNPAPMPPLPYYQNTLTTWGYTTANTTTPQPWESSVLLLLALQRGEDGNSLKVEDLGVASFIGSFGPSPNGQMMPGLLDGWRHALVFSRWPVNSTVLNPGGLPQAKNNNDASDPTGLLQSTTWQGTGGYALFQQYCHAVPPHAANTEATSYRIFPMVASAGPDGKLGLNPFTFAVTAPNDAADNLYPNLFPDH